MKPRNHAIDMLKGLAILMIVYVHMHFAGARFHRLPCEYLLMIALPAFCFAGGYVSLGKTDIPFGRFAAKKARALLVPYTVFFAIGFVLVQIVNGFIRPDINWLWGFLLSGGELFRLGNVPFGTVMSVLWFFPTMFFAYLVFWAAAKCKGRSFVIAAIVLLFISLLFRHIFADIKWTTPYNIKVIPLFAFYMCCGAVFKAYCTGKIPGERKTLLSLALLALGTGIYIVLRGCGQMQDMSTPLFIPVSLLLIVGFYGLFSAVKRFRILEYCGRKSLYIYGIHIIFLKFFALTGINITDNYIRQAVVYITDILLCCICFEAYERIKFKLVGK